LSRVARWLVFKPKNPNSGKFRRALHSLKIVDVFYGHLEYYTDIWDIL
jgi:hypothetical protein